MDFYKFAREELTSSINNYTKDLNVLSAEDILQPRGKARPVSGMTYELVVINQRCIKRFQGQQPDPWPFEGDDWATWPGDPTKADVIAGFEASCNELLAAYDAVGEDNALKEIQTAGEPTNAIKLALFTHMHMMYHCAQLNYIQQLNGDMAVHWSE